MVTWLVWLFGRFGQKAKSRVFPGLQGRRQHRLLPSWGDVNMMSAVQLLVSHSSRPGCFFGNVLKYDIQYFFSLLSKSS